MQLFTRNWKLVGPRRSLHWRKGKISSALRGVKSVSVSVSQGTLFLLLLLLVWCPIPPPLFFFFPFLVPGKREERAEKVEEKEKGRKEGRWKCGLVGRLRVPRKLNMSTFSSPSSSPPPPTPSLPPSQLPSFPTNSSSSSSLRKEGRRKKGSWVGGGPHPFSLALISLPRWSFRLRAKEWVGTRREPNVS